MIHAELAAPSGSSRVKQPPTFNWVPALLLLAPQPAAFQDSFVTQGTGTSFGIFFLCFCCSYFVHLHIWNLEGLIQMSSSLAAG